MRSIPARVALAAGVVIVLAAGAGRADPPDPPPAETLFRQGRASAEAGDYPRACVAFAESLRLDPTPGTLLNLADCEEHVGRLAGAWGHFLRVEAILPATDERREVARERAAAVAPRVPWMTVTLAPDAPRDARVFRDDVELERLRLGAPLPVDPGPHSVLVVAPGYDSRSVTVVAAERETVRVAVSPGPALPHESPRPAPTRAPAWTAGAVGILSLGVGTYFGARALAERSMSDAGCVRGVCTSGQALGEYRSAQSDARMADVALGVGVVALAVGGLLLVTSGHDAPQAAGLRVTGTGLGGAW